MATRTVKKKTNTKTTKTKVGNTTTKKTTTKKASTKSKSTKKKSVANDSEFYANVGRVALRNITNLVSEALPTKEFNDAKSGLLIETKYEDDTPMLYMTANSLNVFISYGIELQEEIVEGFVVPKGRDFRNIVRGLQNFDSPIEMSLSDDEFNISCGDNYKGTIQTYDMNGFVIPPTLDEIKDNEVITLPVKFIQEALNKVAFSCSSDMTIPELTGVLIEQSKNAINIVGSDGNRISYLSMKSKVKNPKTVIIGVKYLNLFNDILKTLEIKSTETLTLYLSDDKLYFVVDNVVVGIQIFAGEYPIEGGYQQFVISEEDCEMNIKLNIDKFVDAMDLAVIHNNSTSDPITMVLTDGDCKLVNSDVSENKFKIDFDAEILSDDTDEDEPTISFSPSFLYDVIRALDGSEFVLSLQSLQGPAIVRPVESKNGDYAYIFSLN